MPHRGTLVGLGCGSPFSIKRSDELGDLCLVRYLGKDYSGDKQRYRSKQPEELDGIKAPAPAEPVKIQPQHGYDARSAEHREQVGINHQIRRDPRSSITAVCHEEQEQVQRQEFQ